jgi:hypothetical protein
VRHLDRHRHGTGVAGHRHQPVAERRQARTVVPERPLTHDRTGAVEQADLVLLGAPIDRGVPGPAPTLLPPEAIAGQARAAKRIVPVRGRGGMARAYTGRIARNIRIGQFRPQRPERDQAMAAVPRSRFATVVGNSYRRAYELTFAIQGNGRRERRRSGVNAFHASQQAATIASQALDDR